MPKIDLASVPVEQGSGYPAPFSEVARERTRRALGRAGGLQDLGVNLTVLPPGEWSSQRHWHARSEEFVFVLEGELVLVEEGEETVVRAGEAAAFPRGVSNAHHFVNRSEGAAVYLEVGTRHADEQVEYPDIDLRKTADGFLHRDGSRYPR